MALKEFWRDITNGSPNDTVNRYRFDTVTLAVTFDSFTTAHGTLGPINPPINTVIYSECQGPDFIQFTSKGNNTGVNKVTNANSPSCCDLLISDFSLVRTNNTSLVTPNGTITVSTTIRNINDYQASIDGGSTWITQVDGVITFSGLPAGGYNVLIKQIAGPCNVTGTLSINDQITYPPLIIAETTLPDLYSPVFQPIILGWKLVNNQASVNNDGQTYLAVNTSDGRDYLATKPIIKILNSVYAGTWQITGVDDPDNPAKFYFGATYTTTENVDFVPFDRQVFQIFCEKTAGNFVWVADRSVYPKETGEYLIEVEGFIQAMFDVDIPVNQGDDITLLRKYYVAPKTFDMETSPTIYNAVYASVPKLTTYLGSLIPLGPAPINFVDRNGNPFPVLFSCIDLPSGRVKNISAGPFGLVSGAPVVNLVALPLSVIDLKWINTAGAITTLNVTPALPSWITMTKNPNDTVNVHINLGPIVVTGDYDGEDYDGDDYLVGSVNQIVGCYTFTFKDGATTLFVLNFCVFPVQSSQGECKGGYNIAWINREGGMNSYLFTDKSATVVLLQRLAIFDRMSTRRQVVISELSCEP